MANYIAASFGAFIPYYLIACLDMFLIKRIVKKRYLPYEIKVFKHTLFIMIPIYLLCLIGIFSAALLGNVLVVGIIVLILAYFIA